MRGELARRLRAETRPQHVQVERSAFMAALLRGTMEGPAYCLLLRNLAHVYAALEHALDLHATHPQVMPIALPLLYRSRALAADLEVLHGSGWALALPLVPAAQAYATHLDQLAATAPARLAAHAYVRYLGDLSGGQLLRGILQRSLGLAEGTRGGIAFYDFGTAAQAAALDTAFRAGLEALDGDVATQDALVEEARHGFALHARLFDELARASGIGTPAQSSTKL